MLASASGRVAVTSVTVAQGARRTDARMMKGFEVNIMLCDDLERLS